MKNKTITSVASLALLALGALAGQAATYSVGGNNYESDDFPDVAVQLGNGTYGGVTDNFNASSVFINNVFFNAWSGDGAPSNGTEANNLIASYSYGEQIGLGTGSGTPGSLVDGSTFNSVDLAGGTSSNNGLAQFSWSGNRATGVGGSSSTGRPPAMPVRLSSAAALILAGPLMTRALNRAVTEGKARK